MPDFAMCFNKTCPRCTECYRFMAITSYFQRYIAYDAENCKDFMEIYGRKIRVTDDKSLKSET